MDNISVYYTHTSACTKVGPDAHQAHKEVRERRAFLGLLCSLSCPPIDQVVRADGEAGPEPSLNFRAASEAERRSRSVRLRLGPTHAAALVNATALRGAMASTCRVFDCSLGAGDHWKGLRHLGPSAAAVGR